MWFDFSSRKMREKQEGRMKRERENRKRRERRYKGERNLREKKREEILAHVHIFFALCSIFLLV